MFRAVLSGRIPEKTRLQKFFINFSLAAKGAVLKWLLLFIRMVSGAERDRKLSYDSPTGGIIFCAAGRKCDGKRERTSEAQQTPRRTVAVAAGTSVVRQRLRRAVRVRPSPLQTHLTVFL